MTATLLAHESALRLLGFGGIFAAMALWEVLAPRRNIVTVDNSLVQRLKVDRHTGAIEYQN